MDMIQALAARDRGNGGPCRISPVRGMAQVAPLCLVVRGTSSCDSRSIRLRQTGMSLLFSGWVITPGVWWELPRLMVLAAARFRGCEPLA